MSDFDAKISREIDLAEDVLRKALLRTVTTGRGPNAVERTVGIADGINELKEAIDDLRRAFETKIDLLIAAIPATRIADDTTPKTRRVKKTKTKKVTKKAAKKAKKKSK
jgi:hypothetical protein